MTASTKSRGWSWGLAVTILLTGLVISVRIQQRRNDIAAANEPTCKGKTLSAWLVVASTVPDDNDPGLNAIREIGPSAVPYLLRAFREGRLPRPARRNDRDLMRWEIQEHAAAALKALGPAAATAVPSLVECLKDNDKKVRSEAAEILGKTGVATKPVRDALLLALNDEESAFNASHALGVLGRKEANVVYELIEVAKSKKKPAAYWAAVSFVELGEKSKPALPVLIELCRNPTPDSDWEAVKAIGMIGTDAAPAVPALVRVLEAGGPWARKCAAISLGRIGPPAKAAIPALRDRHHKEDSNYTRADFARALWRIDHGQIETSLAMARSIVEEELRAAISGDRISYGLMSALDLLGELGTNATPAMPVLMKALQFDDSHVQLCAAWAAWQIDGAQRTAATNVLWKLLGVENFPMEDFGQGPFSGLASLKRDRESYRIRVAAAGMLWQIEPESRNALGPNLKQLLREWNLWTNMKSVIPEEVALAPALEEFMKDETYRDLHPVAEAAFDDVTGAKAERW